jgi:hypothetical protein
MQPDPSINCTADNLKEALEGHFTTEGLMVNPDPEKPTISNLVRPNNAKIDSNNNETKF